MVNATSSDFAGNMYHNAYLDYLGMALDFCQCKPQNYYKLAHEILVFCFVYLFDSSSSYITDPPCRNGVVRHVAISSSMAEGNSGRLQHAAINWDAIVEPE